MSYGLVYVYLPKLFHSLFSVKRIRADRSGCYSKELDAVFYYINATKVVILNCLNICGFSDKIAFMHGVHDRELTFILPNVRLLIGVVFLDSCAS